MAAPRRDRGDFNRRGTKKGLDGPAIRYMPHDIKELFEAGPPLRPFAAVAESGVVAGAGDVGAAGGAGAGADAGEGTGAVADASTDDVDDASNAHSLLTGVSSFADLFERGPPPPPPPPPRSLDEIVVARKEARRARVVAKQKAAAAAWTPQTNPKASVNALATIFVGRLTPAVDERQLAREFSEFGEVVFARIVRNEKGKSRRYGFVEFARESDVKVRVCGAFARARAWPTEAIA
jgi:hypothetical protein